MDKRQYFASYDYYDPHFLDECLEKVRIYRRSCMGTGKYSGWTRSNQNYYGVSSDGTKSSSMVSRGGDAGQLTMAKVNDYRNLIQHQLILITSKRPSGIAKAINSDTRSLHQAIIGSSLVEYQLQQVGWERKFVTAAELDLVANESYSVLDWDATAGRVIRPEFDMDGSVKRMIMTGAPQLRIVAPWNMARDPYLISPDDMKWGIYNYRVNKFDLAIKFPNQSQEILASSDKTMIKSWFNAFNPDESDQITIYCLAHDKTPAVPEGRWTLFVNDAILQDGPFPYKEFNIYRSSQNDVFDTASGYSNNNDLLAIEEVTDALHSALITNNVTFGTQSLLAAKGMGIAHTQIAKGLSLFEVDPTMIDKLRPLQMVKSAPETYQYLEILNRKKETISGINSVVRGDPEGALRSNSGSALALVQAQSLQFNSGGQRSYYHLLSRVCTGLIKMFQVYADAEQVIQITGKVQGQYLKEFKFNKDDLSSISSVVFELTDPISQTVGGNLSIADTLINKGMIKNPRQYISVVRTGSLDAFIEDDEVDELAIKAENERLREGQPVQVVATENHEEHIQAHMSVISSPESKEDERLKNAVLSHIQEHIDIWNQLSMTNPALLIATKQKVLPPPPQPGQQPPPGPDGPPPGPPAPQGAPAANLNRMMGPETPVETQAASVKQPNMPMNPATQQRAPIPGP